MPDPAYLPCSHEITATAEATYVPSVRLILED